MKAKRRVRARSFACVAKQRKAIITVNSTHTVQGMTMVAVKELLSQYIQTTEQVLTEIKLSQEAVHVDKENTNSIVDMALRYLEDAKYYEDTKKFETGLASIAYSEGLLDALRLLGLAEFQWPTKKRGEIGDL